MPHAPQPDPSTIPDGATAEIAVWPGAPPGSAGAMPPESIGLPPAPYRKGSRWVRNVVAPTLAVFLPAPGRAGGAGVVIAPGGGFRWLSIDTEGYGVARRLQARGVAAFVLKYRLAPTPDDPGELERHADAFVAGLTARPVRTDRELGPVADLAVADAMQAMRLVRQGAAEWGLDDRRIGILGFSAGGQVANAVATGYDSAARPAFAASLYGIPPSAAVPADAPPLFVAAAADDPLVAPECSLDLFQRWRAAGRPAELHMFAAGGHGFGDIAQGAPSDHWLDALFWWLQAQRVLPDRAAAG